MSIPVTANPKDATGRAKLPLHLWPASATAAGCVGFLEGELKYGRNNFRASDVAASVYVAAAKRHIDAWFEGQENSPDTGSPHLGNALACIAILVDTQVNGTLLDDRNFVPSPEAYESWVATLTTQCKSLKHQFATLVAPKHWDRRDQVAAEQASAKSLMAGDSDQATTFGPLAEKNTISLAELFTVLVPRRGFGHLPKAAPPEPEGDAKFTDEEIRAYALLHRP